MFLYHSLSIETVPSEIIEVLSTLILFLKCNFIDLSSPNDFYPICCDHENKRQGGRVFQESRIKNFDWPLFAFASYSVVLVLGRWILLKFVASYKCFAKHPTKLRKILPQGTLFGLLSTSFAKLDFLFQNIVWEVLVF